MKYRFSPGLNRFVSEIGFGAWQLGSRGTWGTMSRDEAISLVKTAYSEGINFFDTAPGYGDGNSESLLGEALQGIREKVIVNTKVGHGPDGAWEFTPDGIRKSVERSLGRLRTPYLDCVLLHNPAPHLLQGDNPLFGELRSLREEGKIRLFGVSIDTADELRLALDHPAGIRAVEILFNMIHQEPRALFDECRERGIFLVTKVPLDSGWLTGKYDEKSVFSGIRSRWTPEQIATRSAIVVRLKAIVGSEDLVLPALRYILSFPAVTSVIPGMKDSFQLMKNASASQAVLDASVVERINAYYDQELKGRVIPW